MSSAATTASVEQQNDIVRRYCRPCHNDAESSGGLSLQRFRAARPDSYIARLMATKISEDGAIFAAGLSIPDPALLNEVLGVWRALPPRRLGLATGPLS